MQFSGRPRLVDEEAEMSLTLTLSGQREGILENEMALGQELRRFWFSSMIT
ncbi:hypothetical protein NKDENANG_03771 [Candidatus Entotheonellaceae bacterium PAL068K]